MLETLVKPSKIGPKSLPSLSDSDPRLPGKILRVFVVADLQQKLQQNDSQNKWKDCEWIVGRCWQIVLEGGGTLCYQSFNRMPGVHQAFTLEIGVKFGGSIPTAGSICPVELKT